MERKIILFGFFVLLLLVSGCAKQEGERVLVDYIKCDSDSDCAYVTNIQRGIPGCVNLEVFEIEKKDYFEQTGETYEVDPSISCSCVETEVTEGEGILESSIQKICKLS